MSESATRSVDLTAATSEQAVPLGEQSAGQLVATISRDLSLLVSREIELAKTEIVNDVKAAGLGAGMFGGAGFLGLFAAIFLSVAAAFGIGALLSLGWGFLIVGGAYLLLAAVLGLMGKKQVGRVGPPRRTIATVKDDLAWAKHPRRP